MEQKQQSSENRDPLTGTPGAHPLGTGIGAAAGGIVAGGTVGAVAGPVGAAVGAALGAVFGGLGGKAAAEHFDPTIVDDHWRDRYESEPYHEAGMTYDDYSPAYRLGAESRTRYTETNFDEVEDLLASEYDEVRGDSRLEWDGAKAAARAAWETDYRY